MICSKRFHDWFKGADEKHNSDRWDVCLPNKISVKPPSRGSRSQFEKPAEVRFASRTRLEGTLHRWTVMIRANKRRRPRVSHYETGQ